MWYYGFTVAVFLLWLGARPKDRAALAIVALATLASALLVALWTSHLTSPLKLAVPATIETATCITLLCIVASPTTYFQAVLVTVAWCSHYLCFADLVYNSNLVYDNYEAILAAVAVAQLLAFHDTYLYHFRRWWSALGAGRVAAIRAGGVPAAVFSGKGATRLQETAP